MNEGFVLTAETTEAQWKARKPGVKRTKLSPPYIWFDPEAGRDLTKDEVFALRLPRGGPENLQEDLTRCKHGRETFDEFKERALAGRKFPVFVVPA